MPSPPLVKVKKQAIRSIMPMQKPTEWATIGKIVAPFGIRGEMKVFSLSDIPNRFAQLDALYISPNYVRASIETVRPFKGDMYLLKLKGIDDANSAETLRKCDLCVPVDQLATLPTDSYYQHDIYGLRVFTLVGRDLGTITDIIETGSNDVYVVTDAEDHQFLIPAIKQVIKQVDLIRRVMYIEPMRGLIDDDAVIDTPETATQEEEEVE
jgi:16S rRNA processing protein RimM